MSAKEFHQNVHSLRALAIWSIVAAHVIDITPWSANSIWPRLLANVLENGSVLFVFVAGYLFQHLHSRYRYLPYLKRRVSESYRSVSDRIDTGCHFGALTLGETCRRITRSSPADPSPIRSAGCT